MPNIQIRIWHLNSKDSTRGRHNLSDFYFQPHGIVAFNVVGSPTLHDYSLAAGRCLKCSARYCGRRCEVARHGYYPRCSPRYAATRQFTRSIGLKSYLGRGVSGGVTEQYLRAFSVAGRVDTDKGAGQ